MYFCGYSPECSHKSPVSVQLQRAKQNVDRFDAVGVLDELDKSLEVFEILLPRIFSGARKVLEKIKSNITGKGNSSL